MMLTTSSKEKLFGHPVFLWQEVIKGVIKTQSHPILFRIVFMII